MDGRRRRLARAVHELIGGSYSHAKRAVQDGHVLVGERVVTDPGFWVGDGDTVLHRPDLPRRSRPPAAPPIVVLHADEDVVVVAKPPDLLVHPTAEGDDDTVLARCAAALARRAGSSPRLWVVHRLDQGTSGVMVMALCHEAAEALQVQFRVHSVTRRYLALVRGDLGESVTVDREIGRPRPGARRGAIGPGRGGQRAITFVTPMERLGRATMVEAVLGTGRTHQVRVHLSYLGHPVLGDSVYGRPEDDPVAVGRLALHAAHLTFAHPRSGASLSFDLPLPDDLAKPWRQLRERVGGSGRLSRERESAAASPPPHRRTPRRPADR